jgi:hypothetical protein
LYDSSSSEEEFDTEEDEDIAMIVTLHKSKWPKKGCEGIIYLSRGIKCIHPSGALVLHVHVGSTPTLVFLLSFLLVYIFSLATKLHTKDAFHAERLGHSRLH